MNAALGPAAPGTPQRRAHRGLVGRPVPAPRGTWPAADAGRAAADAAAGRASARGALDRGPAADAGRAPAAGAATARGAGAAPVDGRCADAASCTGESCARGRGSNGASADRGAATVRRRMHPASRVPVATTGNSHTSPRQRRPTRATPCASTSRAPSCSKSWSTRKAVRVPSRCCAAAAIRAWMPWPAGTCSRHWRFQPALRDGVAVPARGRVPVRFAIASG